MVAQKVFFIQHGEAGPETVDPARPLTDRGKAEVQRIAQYAAHLKLSVAGILHSGKLRAKQTAEILAQHLQPPEGLREVQGLAPLDAPDAAKSLIEEAAKPIMLVGHLPHLSRLVSLLVFGDPDQELIRFRMAGIICLARREEQWRIQWILTPDIIPTPEP